MGGKGNCWTVPVVVSAVTVDPVNTALVSNRGGPICRVPGKTVTVDPAKTVVDRIGIDLEEL